MTIAPATRHHAPQPVPEADGPPPVARREARAMGSPLRLQVAGETPASTVDAVWAAVLDEFEAVEDVLSRFRATSEIHLLRTVGGHATEPSRRLVAALTAADRARRVTEGRFDPRVLHDLERLGSRPIELPSAVETGPTASARPDPAAPILRRAGRRGLVEVPSPVDFGGIGKGLALRWAARRAAAGLGDRPFLLEAGGDIVGHGAPASHGWRVGIEDPRPAAASGARAAGAAEASPALASEAGPVVVAELPLAGGAVATSSIRLAHWRAPNGRLVHHLIDPRTGEPGGEGLLAVTVAGPDPAWAEVWSKGLFLEGRARIAGLARARGLAAWWVTVDGEVEMTPAARLRTIWVGDEA
ncbi:MAG TPA: FAD:protein FMN transferase [Candidatus Limnocylindrales bacterium]|nr:FAD:protein FMN transferase [Candidatus Limnocylindrales bacterium]